MVWALISTQGTGTLHFVNGMVDSRQYSEVIQTKMLPQAREWFPDGNYVFMHDKAPCHMAKCVSQVLSETGIEVLPWPGNSPDLNPIENVWNYVKQRVRAGQEITSQPQLKDRLLQVWAQDPGTAQMVQKCIRSTPDRVAAAIAARGGISKY